MKSESDSSNAREVTGDARPTVPVFTCNVYVRRNEDDSVVARVANLAGIEASGASERDALSKVTREFKSRVFKMIEDQQTVPWIEPLPSPLDNEQVRSIPVHL
ncbi:MAG: hypothetical protein AB8B55_20405 [Mariniblastus sp.]